MKISPTTEIKYRAVSQQSPMFDKTDVGTASGGLSW